MSNETMWIPCNSSSPELQTNLNVAPHSPWWPIKMEWVRENRLDFKSNPTAREENFSRLGELLFWLESEMYGEVLCDGCPPNEHGCELSVNVHDWPKSPPFGMHAAALPFYSFQESYEVGVDNMLQVMAGLSDAAFPTFFSHDSPSLRLGRDGKWHRWVREITFAAPGLYTWSVTCSACKKIPRPAGGGTGFGGGRRDLQGVLEYNERERLRYGGASGFFRGSKL